MRARSEGNRPLPELLKVLRDYDNPEYEGRPLMSLFSPTEISTLLQSYPLSDSESMLGPQLGPEERTRRRLGVLRLREQLSQTP